MCFTSLVWFVSMFGRWFCWLCVGVVVRVVVVVCRSVVVLWIRVRDVRCVCCCVCVLVIRDSMSVCCVLFVSVLFVIVLVSDVVCYFY